MDEVHKIIDNIQKVSNVLGLFCSKMMGKDEIDDINYYDDPDHEEYIIFEDVPGTDVLGIRFPYASVCFDKDNQWKFWCICLDFYIINDIFPTSFLDLPKILKIPRSDGTIQDGFVKKNSGIKIRKSNSHNDGYDKICIEVAISNRQEFKELSNMNDENSHNLELGKTMPLDTLLNYNPEIKEIYLSLELFNENDFVEDSLTELETKIKIMKHYNFEFIEWFKKKVNPCIKRLEDRVKWLNLIE